jgi:hypothetical protein
MHKFQAIGCDPEYSLHDGTSYVPVNGLIGGTKEKPVQVDLGSWQEDCVAAEIGIEPAVVEDDFVKNIKIVTDQLSDFLKPKNISLAVVSSVDFPPEQLDSAAAWEFGCDPDFSAYTLKRNPRPEADGTLRTFGGHVHVSWENADSKGDKHFVQLLVVLMDLYLGVPSVLYDNDTLRRSLYGAAGSFRYKPYGIEYRSLSNFWLRSEALQKWVFRNTRKAFEMAESGMDIEKDIGLIEYVINNSDRSLAMELCAKYKIPLCEEEEYV